MADQASSSAAASTNMTFRGLVMFLCLVALPVLALHGTKWEDLAKTIPELGKKLLALGRDCTSASGPKGMSEAPLFSKAPPAVATGDVALAEPSESSSIRRLASAEQTPRGAANARPARDTLDGPPAVVGDRMPERASPGGNEYSAPGGRDRGVALAGFQSNDPETSAVQGIAASDPFPGLARPSAVDRLNTDPPRRGPSQREAANLNRASLVPVARRDRDAPAMRPIRPLPARIAEVDNENAGSTPRAGDRFTYVLDRLRELGAAYYLLEAWGSEGQRFRFHCKMAIGGNPGYTRHFEATDPDPLQAMGRVLSEVEAWRAGP